MKKSACSILTLSLLALILPALAIAEKVPSNITGIYTSNATQNEIVILKLNPDNSSTIESWYRGNTIVETGTWYYDESLVTVRYKDFVQEFKFKKVLLLEYGSFRRIQGLKPVHTEASGGYLESVKFVDKVILDMLVEDGTIQVNERPTAGYINYISIIFVTFFISAFIGMRRPFLIALICAALVPAIAYLIDELHPSLPIFTIIGFVFSYLWSIIFRWIFQKTRVALDSKLRFLSGFSSGRGSRSFFVIGPKGGKSRD